MFALALAAATVLHAQETRNTTTDASKRQTKVMVSGDSRVQAQPDTAMVGISVVTQGKSALEVQQENATKSEAVVRAVKAAAGTGAEVKTSGYNVQPTRIYRDNQPPTITGYEVRNTVTVTMSELARVGNVIDAASQAGANEVAGVSFTLRQDRAVRDQALAEATKEAMSKAQVVARALGGRVVGITEVQAEGFYRPQPVYQGYATVAGAASSVSTPIEIGSLDITSRVQLVAIVELNL